MAMRKTLARILSSSSSLSQTLILPPRSPSLLRRSHSDPCAVPTRLLQRRPMLHPAVSVPLPLPAGPFPALPVGDELIDRIRATAHRDRIRLDGLAPSPPPPKAAAEEEAIEVAAARKAARAAEMETARERLRGTERSCVAYGEFARICAEVAGADRGSGLARALDDSGAVIVLRDVVFLRPEMLAKAIESMIPSAISPAHDPRRHKELHKELKELKAQKAAIDATAEAQVRRELWAGLGLLTLQTIGFMRLTFWELSWDVMEPICFFVTSLYFMAGYAFFLRTSRDPSFEGFFHRRFAAKQKRLMRAHNFNLSRFDELSNAHQRPGSLPSPPALKHTCSAAATSFYCDCHHKSSFLGTIH